MIDVRFVEEFLQSGKVGAGQDTLIVEGCSEVCGLGASAAAAGGGGPVLVGRSRNKVLQVAVRLVPPPQPQ